MPRRRPNPPRDDRAWPREAGTASALIGGTCLAAALMCAGGNEKPISSLVFLVLALLLGASVMVVPLRSWLSGGSIPAWLGLAPIAFVFGGGIVFNRIFGSGVGILVAMFGVLAGMMLGNIWAMRAARANRSRKSK